MRRLVNNALLHDITLKTHNVLRKWERYDGILPVEN